MYWSYNGQRTISELFNSPDTFKPEGCWYYDAKTTAFALYGMKGLKEERRVEINSLQLRNILSDCKKHVNGTLAEYRGIAIGLIITVLALMGFGLVAFLLVATHLAESSFYTQFAFGTILLPILPYFAPKVCLLRHRLR